MIKEAKRKEEPKEVTMGQRDKMKENINSRQQIENEVKE
jgi:hypothetical protein